MSRPSAPWFRVASDTWVTKINGKLYTLARGKGNLKAARAEFHRLMTRIGAVDATPGDLAIWALRDLFLDECERTVGPDALASYREWTGRFVRFVGRTRLCASIIPHDVTRWLAAAPKRGKAWGRSTRATAAKKVKRMFRWGHQQGLLSGNPLSGLKVGGYDQRQCVLTPQQAEAVLAAVDGPVRALLEFLRETGCRPSEAYRLEAHHVDARAGIARFHGKTSDQTGQLRVLYLTPRALEILRPLIDERPRGPLFLNSRGNPWCRHSVQEWSELLRRRLGIPQFTAESFRHTFATEAAFRLLPAELAGLMGSSIKTVSKYYIHADQKTQELRAAAERARGDASATGSTS